ncbi:mitochondrial carrier family [Plasmopara halstedii]|uniref:Mitochondrial carrier family n=1 Tax=Plasmopara halstedii TaxID=4781 RepID=A0A0N7L7N8_PLAHL|nr:mitochondrial carrier family [Plasmopara halstedii]CEG47595.1 mitochondrial carrier family [Plasmopara halstedii]|eukprot:XP_024583964.1 mitochondrial carrier family [Plasmopara halstedii]
MVADGSASSQLPTLMGSAAAGMISRVFCHPMDTIKARLQASTTKGQTIASHLNLQSFSLRHFRGLYRGIGTLVWNTASARRIPLLKRMTQLLDR